MTLLIRPQVVIGDGPIGYLVQLAEANHLTVSDIFAIGLAFRPDVLRKQRCAFPEGVDPALDRFLSNVAACIDEHPTAWIKRSSRCCPICLGELARWRVGWEILYADACPTHRVWLIDVCSCGRPITWQRRTLLKCDCGRPLTNQIPVACPDTIATLSDALVGKIIGNASVTGVGPIDRLDVAQLQRLIRFLGSYGDPDPGPRPQKISNQDRLATSWRLTSLAAELLKGWPNSLYGVLDRMQREHAEEGCGRLSGRFGYFYTALYKGFAEDAFAPMRDVFENYIADHWRGALGKRNRRLPPGILQRAAWIPANHACQRLGISQRRLNTLIAGNLIAGETRMGPSGREFIVVRRVDVDKQLEALKQEVDLFTAAWMLGLTKRRMQVLLPRLFPEAYKTTGAASPWAIPRGRLDRLIGAISAAKPVRVVPAGSTSLAHVLRFWAWTDDAVADVLSAVITGEVVPSNILNGAEGVPALIFPDADLKGWHVRTQHRSAGVLGIPDVAERVGIKQEVAYALVRAGILKTVSISDGTKYESAGVSPEQLEEFGRQYVLARDLAKMRRRSPKSVIQKLELLEIQPVCGPKVDGCRQVLYANTPALASALATL